MILEEDLAISVDILSYFKQLLPVLENDESLYCISAWNDQVSEINREIPVEGNGVSVGVLCKPLLEQDKIDMSDRGFEFLWFFPSLFLNCLVLSFSPVSLQSSGSRRSLFDRYTKYVITITNSNSM